MMPTKDPIASGGSFDEEGGFGVAAKQILRLPESVTLAAKEVDALTDIVEQCLATFIRVTEAPGDRSDDEVMGSLGRIMVSVEAVAKRIEQISEAAMSVSTLSLAGLAQRLQKTVASKLSSDGRGWLGSGQ